MGRLGRGDAHCTQGLSHTVLSPSTRCSLYLALLFFGGHLLPLSLLLVVKHCRTHRLSPPQRGTLCLQSSDWLACPDSPICGFASTCYIPRNRSCATSAPVSEYSRPRCGMRSPSFPIPHPPSGTQGRQDRLPVSDVNISSPQYSEYLRCIFISTSPGSMSLSVRLSEPCQFKSCNPDRQWQWASPLALDAAAASRSRRIGSL